MTGPVVYAEQAETGDIRRFWENGFTSDDRSLLYRNLALRSFGTLCRCSGCVLFKAESLFL
jgi:hypothetical protein